MDLTYVTQVLVDYWVYLFVFIAVIAVIIYFLMREGPLPYEKQPHLFTPAEQNFLKTIDRVIPDHLRVFGKIRIADILKVNCKDKKRFWRYFTKISSKHLDYVLVDKQTLTFVAAIELDDSSHQRKDRIERDVFVDKACAVAGLPLIRVPAKRRYEADDIKQMIISAVRAAK